MIRIAIDGPGGAGKSSLAKAVASRLGIIYVDTGALYRTIGLFMLNNGINPSDNDAVVSSLNKFTLELNFIDGKQVILLNGEDVKDTIRTPEVSLAASAVSAIKEVRDYLLNMQRTLADKHSLIMDGRDIGTVIIPQAEIKIFLTASPEARARRRYEELIAKGKEVSFEQVFEELAERDKNDSTREIAPCVPAENAIILDNSDLNAEQTIDAVIDIVEKFKKTQKKTSYMKTHAIVAPLIRFFQRIKITGLENIPSEGGYIICSNHIAARDVLLLGASCPRQIKFIAKKELFSIPIIGRIMKSFGAVKIDRGGNDVGAIRKSIELLHSGDLIAIFPQGHRYPGVHPAITETKSGTGLIAYRSKCDIIPVCIKTKNNKYRLFRKIEIIFGQPIETRELMFGIGGNSEYETATKIIFDKIISLGDFGPVPNANANGESAN